MSSFDTSDIKKMKGVQFMELIKTTLLSSPSKESQAYQWLGLIFQDLSLEDEIDAADREFLFK